MEDGGMRILFGFVGGVGHFEPMVPIARAAQAAGHSVGVACGPSLVPIVEAGGFSAFGIGPLPPAQPQRRMALKEVDTAREERDLRERFADAAARVRAEGVRRLARAWRSDVIVADEVDFGTVLAAEMLEVPYATVLVIAAGSLVRQSVVADTLDSVRSEYGLPSDPDLAAPSRYLVLSPFPPRLRDPAFPLPATAHMFRGVEIRRANVGPGSWPQHLSGAPSIYFTLGTEFNLESGDLFTRVLAGLRQLPVNVFVTVGRQIDPAELGEQPANVRIERYLPQAEILPHCQLVVFHGGSGTLIGALAHGLPMLVCAIGADQPYNALRCSALGLGVSLNPVRLTPDEVRDSVDLLLADPSYRQAAQELQAEIAAQPGPATTVTLLERLARERGPITNR
jgi:UDP:flavonoid glycosyltransferase YjiC (YdhE family)